MPSKLKVLARSLAPGALAAAGLFPGTVPALAQAGPGAVGELTYVGDLLAPVRGGHSRRVEFLDNLDLVGRLDLETLLGLRRTRVRAHVQSNRGGSISARVGDLQGVSNIEAASAWRLYELWVEHNVVPGRVSLLAGVYDLNAELDVIPIASDFVNSSFGFGPELSGSGVLGPSTYPLTTLGVRAKVRPRPHFYGAFAIMDGSPGSLEAPDRSRFALGGSEGALLAAELGYTRPRRGGSEAAEPTSREQTSGRRIGRGRLVQGLDTKLAVGAWTYTRDFESWDPDRGPAGSRGLYALLERAIFRLSEGRSLSIFGRFGVADDAANRLSSYWGGGAVLSGTIPSRLDDAIGVGIAHARNGTPFLESAEDPGLLVRAETVVELYYHLALFDEVQLQPDLQWILDPGTQAGRDHALVVGLRGIVTLDVP